MNRFRVVKRNTRNENDDFLVTTSLHHHEVSKNDSNGTAIDNIIPPTVVVLLTPLPTSGMTLPCCSPVPLGGDVETVCVVVSSSTVEEVVVSDSSSDGVLLTDSLMDIGFGADVKKNKVVVGG